MTTMISPSFPDSKLDNPSVDDLIDVYEDRIRYWLLEQVANVLKNPHGHPAAFCLLLTYFEGAWSYNIGESSRGKSKAFFASGFVDVFRGSGSPENLLRRLGDLLYEDARCGFFHDGMFRERVYFATMNRDLVITLPKVDGRVDVDGTIQTVLVDPARCYAAVQKHFDNFIRAVRDPQNVAARESFAALFKEQCDWEKSGPIIGLPEPSSNQPS